MKACFSFSLRKNTREERPCVSKKYHQANIGKTPGKHQTNDKQQTNNRQTPGKHQTNDRQQNIQAIDKHQSNTRQTPDKRQANTRQSPDKHHTITRQTREKTPKCIHPKHQTPNTLYPR